MTAQPHWQSQWHPLSPKTTVPPCRCSMDLSTLICQTAKRVATERCLVLLATPHGISWPKRCRIRRAPVRCRSLHCVAFLDGRDSTRRKPPQLLHFAKARRTTVAAVLMPAALIATPGYLGLVAVQADRGAGCPLSCESPVPGEQFQLGLDPQAAFVDSLRPIALEPMRCGDGRPARFG